jgi:hypothetical protein
LAPLIADKEKTDQKKKTATPADLLPANIPAWFKEYDTDGDGQIGLYEWKAKGHSVADFRKADLNGDGFITFEELLRSGFFVPNMATLRPQQNPQAQKPPRQPQTAHELVSQVGKFFYFEITGSTKGMVWGTDIYTVDSPFATTAVHAGVLEVGQKGFVKVTILPGQESYEGSTRNGVTTHDFGAFGGSYRIEALKPAP